MSCAEMDGLDRVVEKESDTSRRYHPLTLSWIFGDKSQTTFSSATNLARQSDGDAGHLMSNVLFEAPKGHKHMPPFGDEVHAVEATPSPRSESAEASPLADRGFQDHQRLSATPRGNVGLEDNQQAAEMRATISGELETHACKEHCREDDSCGQCIPSNGILQHPGSTPYLPMPGEGMCSACLQWHLSSVELLKAQHQAHVDALQEHHATMLDDAKCLCEDFQVFNVIRRSLGCEQKSFFCHALLN